MPTYRLGETIARVYNPLPACSEADIVRDAGLDGLWPNPHGSAFALKFIWSQGPEREEIVVNPGEYVELPLSLANHAYSELAGNGLVLLSRDPVTKEWPEMDSDVVKAKIFEGLQRARQFYLMRGSIPLSKARQRHAITTEEQWNGVKIKFKGGLMNQAREARVEAERVRVATSPRPARVSIPAQKGAAA